MARGKKTGGRDFGPDNPPPKSPGAPKLPKEIRDLRKLTVEQVEEIISTLLTANHDTLDEIRKDPNAPFLKRIIVNILYKTFSTGNMGQLDLLLNRVIGKVQEKIRHEVVRPSVLLKRDGTQVVFGMESEKDEE